MGVGVSVFTRCYRRRRTGKEICTECQVREEDSTTAIVATFKRGANNAECLADLPSVWVDGAASTGKEEEESFSLVKKKPRSSVPSRPSSAPLVSPEGQTSEVLLLLTSEPRGGGCGGGWETLVADTCDVSILRRGQRSVETSLQREADKRQLGFGPISR
ncbi:unnamed protein product [Pleuronectes platessa]|uniref:Uncharacterized protein n=1 Tax=Pleuronectes platessa TaxID=8262 RepID=A0A9N7V6E0_PLEPL|nr:unnamed protein product [Pleuronectes platessa]